MPKPGGTAERRMLCTTNFAFLNSAKGRTVLNFRPTRKPPKYNPIQKNLLIVWDIFMHNYRSINMDSCDLITTIPANDIFWAYFTDKISIMTPQQKTAFMNV